MEWTLNWASHLMKLLSNSSPFPRPVHPVCRKNCESKVLWLCWCSRFSTGSLARLKKLASLGSISLRCSWEFCARFLVHLRDAPQLPLSQIWPLHLSFPVLSPSVVSIPDLSYPHSCHTDSYSNHPQCLFCSGLYSWLIESVYQWLFY